MNNLIPCIIIDDDLSAIGILKEFISEFPRLNLEKTYTKPVAALNDISLLQESHLIFMDIDMPNLSGIGLADNLKDQHHNIIFTTCYPQYAIGAFKVRAKHYLLKPFNLAEFARVVNDVLKECYASHTFEKESRDAFFFRASDDKGRVIKVLKKDVMFLQGSNNHVHLYTDVEDYSIYLTIKEMQEKLKHNPTFYRVHKSYIINSDFVKKIEGNKIDLGKYEVLMASHYKAAFSSYVEQNFLSTKRT